MKKKNLQENNYIKIQPKISLRKTIINLFNEKSKKKMYNRISDFDKNSIRYLIFFKSVTRSGLFGL